MVVWWYGGTVSEVEVKPFAVERFSVDVNAVGYAVQGVDQ